MAYLFLALAFLNQLLKPALLALFIILVIGNAGATITLSNAEFARLAESESWLNLLHFRSKIFIPVRESQADDPAFFYAASGKQNAAAELQAFVSAINQPDSLDEHPACRFPARYQWLIQQLQPAHQLEDIHCPELERWLTDLNAKRITLVYAASYLNSPSSMFGHTFLRIDPPDMSADKLLLTNTISYAADAGEHDNEVVFAYRGIFGGYPGVTLIEPYYQKLKLYNDIENRDLWEYELDLNSEEVHRLLLHAWEIKDIRFDYFFFDENCAYRLFTLIDIARPGVQLTQAIPSLRAIPADTVKIVVKKNIVSKITYRPSSASIIEHQIEALSESQKDAIEDFLEMDFSAINDTLSKKESAEALETAYELQQFRTIDEKLPREISAPASFALLQQRGQMEIQTQQRLPAAPAVRDDQGHDTLRFGLFGGRIDNDRYIAFEWRPAYHDLDDPLPGYRRGAHLQFFKTELRWYTDNNELQLEQFKFVEIISFTPRTRFFRPWSWQAGFGARRSRVRQGQRPLTPYINGFFGSTVFAGPTLLSAALTANAEPSAHLPSGGTAEAGLGLFLNYQSETIRLSAKAEQRADFLGENESRRMAEAKLSYSVLANHAIHLRVQVLDTIHGHTEDISIGWYGYF